MQHAADRFERVQPHNIRNIPFAIDEWEATPSLAESIGWIFLAFAFLALCLGFMGI